MKIMKEIFFRVMALVLVFVTMTTISISAFAAPGTTTANSAPIVAPLPDTVVSADGKSAVVTVKASTKSGTNLKYQWYFAQAGSGSYAKSSISTNTYVVTMSDARDGRKVYCVVTDGNGRTTRSETVTLKLAAPIKITAQPKDVSVAAGASARANVKATGEGELKYQWYFKDTADSSFRKSSVTAAAYSVAMSKNRDGRKVYCVISDNYGQKITSRTATLMMSNTLAILVQPTNSTVAIGDKISTTVTATGTGNLTYTWYVADSGSSTFTKSVVKKPTYEVTMTSARDGRRAYCIIADSTGKTVTSNIVTFTAKRALKITSQPKDTKVAAGAAARVSVTATGTGLKYQWYFAEAGSGKFYKSSVTTATYSVSMTAARDGRRVYCVVSDGSGNTVTSNIVTLSVEGSLKIISQPKDTKVAAGVDARATVTVSGSGLKYQWYIASATSNVFQKSAVTSSTYSVTMSKERSGRRAFCVITDNAGNKVTSDTVTFTMAAPITIIQEPSNVQVTNGKIAYVSVKATGEGKLTYQWYIRNKNGINFAKSSVTGATYSATMSNSTAGRQVYCVITDNYGQEVTTRTVKMFNDINGLNVLIVGNSHSLDAFWFLYSAYLDQYPDTEVCIGILYYSGGSISEHVTAANNGEAVNRYYKNDSGKWVIEYGVTHEYILSDMPWDVILTQPGKEDIVHENLNKKGRYELAEIIDKYVKNPHEIMWHITWPCPNDETFFSPDYIRQPPEGYKDRLIALYDFNPINQYAEKIEQTKKHILNDPLYTNAVCTGAAVMQAHLTQGVPQIELYRDYTHLNDFGRLMVDYSLVAQLTGEPIDSVGIDEIDVRSRFYLFKDQGDLIITDKMKNIIIEAANYSLESPWIMPKQTNK